MPTDDKRPIDFDQHTPYYKENWISQARDFHATGTPIGWSNNHGGFWLVAGWEACTAVLNDWETFTSYNDLEGTGNGGRGQMIPQSPYRLALGESDPPLHTQRRRLEAPFFTPRAMRRWAPVAQEFVDEAIDAVAESGHTDLINDIIMPTAARTTLHLLGYKLDWHEAAEIAHKISYVLPDSPEYPYAALARLRQDFRAEIQDRKAHQTDDLISALAHGVVDGVPLSEDDAETMLNVLVFGGFDTTTSATGSALRWFAHHPEHVPRVLEDANHRKNAIEELLRVYPPTGGMARTATKDTELLGQRIQKGERVQLWFAAANRDPSKFSNPDMVDLERENASDNLTFSAGPHRCLGSPLAKIEINIMVETILRRLPDLRVDEAHTETYPNIGFVNGFITEPATFSPRTLQTV